MAEEDFQGFDPRLFHFLEQLARHPLIRHTRGIGGIAVLELEPESRAGYLDDRGRRVAAAALDGGLLLRPLGNIVYLVPPYVITDDEIDWAFDIIGRALAAAAG